MTVTLDGTTGVSGVAGQINGSASSPTLRGVDTNTGVYFPQADQVAIAIDGSIRALFSTTSEFTGSLRNTTSAFLSTDSGALHVGAATAPGNSSKMQVTSTSGSTDGNQSALILSQGGSGENGGQVKLINSYSGVSTPNKHIRVNNSGQLEVINSAYSGVILSLTDAGVLTVGSRGISKASMPAGTILQVQTAVSGPASQAISSTSPVAVTGLSISFTPLYSNSLIVIDGILTGNFTHVFSWGVFKDGVATVNTTGYGNSNEPNMQFTTYSESAGADARMFAAPLMHRETAGSTSARTYQVYCTSGWGGSVYTSYINNRSSQDMASFSYLRIMEVAV